MCPSKLFFYLFIAEVGSDPTSRSGDFFLIEKPLILLTWVTFLILAFILHKFVWNPVLSLLENREKKIRNALESAEKAKKFLTEAEEKKRKTLEEAERKRAEIIETAKKDALTVAGQIQQDAEKTAEKLVSDAKNEIKATLEKTKSELKIETGKLAIEIAEKILREKMTYNANKEIVERIIKGM